MESRADQAKPVHLKKVAISSGLAKKIFDRRYVLKEMAKVYAKNHSNPLEMLSPSVSLNKARHLIRRNNLIAEKATRKLDRASEMLDKRRMWEANKEKYGVRNPSLLTKVKKGISDLVESSKDKLPKTEHKLKQRLAYAT